MTLLKKIFLIALCGLCIIRPALSTDAHYLIKEMETLRDSLPLDDPARIDLTLRLADIYFDVSIKEGGQKDYKTLKANRMKALGLYRHSLNGTDGVKKAEGLTRLKIQFQMARLLSRLEEYEMAEPYYLTVQSAKDVPKKMKEQASLALAEWYEEDGQYEKSKSYYDVAIGLCDVNASCNYAHYRKAWLFFKDTKLELAISEMKKSLWATEDEVRESSLQDLIMFMSNAFTDGKKELKYTKSLAKKLERPKLVRQLVEAFYVAGNRKAGSHLLAYINEGKPNLYYEVRLLEEFYGFRKWEKVEKYLADLSKRTAKDLPAKKEEKQEVRKLLRRYLVQVDSEAEVIPELNKFLLQSIDVYLSIYPNDELRKKMQQGWLKAQKDQVAKIDRLGKWIEEDIKFGVKDTEVRKLRQTRLSLAQKENMSEVIIIEALAVSKILGTTKEAREFDYVAARELYQTKKYAKALELFKSLVSGAIETKNFDKWSLLSQNLALDIFNKQEKYQSIVDQVALWTAATAGVDNKEIKKDNEEMSKIQTDARFEQAVKMVDSPESLKEFYSFCFSGIYPEKSCPNAKVLAVKFSDQQKLVSLLEKEGDKRALMTEYELMGRYSDAAALQEKLELSKKDASYNVYLKTALLYELDLNFDERNRILKNMISKMKKDNDLPNEVEGAMFLTLDEAGLIDSSSLHLPWTTARKLSLARRLQLTKPSSLTKKMIMEQKENQGPIWSKLILEKVQKSFASVSKVKFYGRHSKWLFKKRTRTIDKFVALAKEYLEHSDYETRTYILDMITKTYAQMTEDILATPLPEGLDEQTLAQVQTQLQNMAAPFEKVRLDYQRLLDDQLKELSTDKPERFNTVSENLANANGDYARYIELTPVESRVLAKQSVEGGQELRQELLKRPDNRRVLTSLLNHYENSGAKRFIAYYQGRVESLPVPVVKNDKKSKKQQEVEND